MIRDESRKITVLFVSLGVLAAVSAVPREAEAQPHRYIVKMKSGGARDQVSRRLTRAANVTALSSELTSNVEGVTQARAYSRLGLVVVDGDSDAVESALKQNALVDYFEPDVEWKVASTDNYPASLDGAPWMRDLLHLNESDPDPGVVYTGNAPVVVAVLDTGATIAHPFLSPGLSVNEAEAAGASGVDDDGNRYIDDLHSANVFTLNGSVDEVGTDHGSHVAGLVKSVRDQAIASNNPEAAAVQLLPIRFINSSGVGSTAGAIAGLEYAATRGVKVVNASWGAKGTDAYSRALFDAMADLYNNQDVFFAVAAGNSDRSGPNDNDAVPYFPANFGLPSQMTVASVTPSYTGSGEGAVFRDYYLSTFSNYGATSVDVAAPGDMVNDDSMTPGVWSVNAGYTSTANQFVRKRGTSMATPIVAGVAAVMRAINPALTSYEVKQLILSSGTVTSRLSKIKGSVMVNAAAAFADARAAATQGVHPAAQAPSYGGSTSESAPPAAGTKSKGGMCGTVRDVSENEGFWGGNSLGLLMSFYFAALVIRRTLRRTGVRGITSPQC